jgi:hypothetical protein
MKHIGIKTSILALVAAITGCMAFAAPAQGQGLDLQSYCQSLYGYNSNAILLDDRDAYTWRCTQGDEMYEMSIEDACDQQYNPSYSASLGSRSDPYSWACY